jgi:hypothetical protein
MNALVTAALVPEPSTLGMAAAAMGMAVVMAVRKACRNRRSNEGLRTTALGTKMQ